MDRDNKEAATGPSDLGAVFEDLLENLAPLPQPEAPPVLQEERAALTPEQVYARLRNEVEGEDPSGFTTDQVNDFAELENPERRSAITRQYLVANSKRAEEINDKARKAWHEKYGETKGVGQAVTNNLEFVKNVEEIAQPEALEAKSAEIALKIGREVAWQVGDHLRAADDLRTLQETGKYQRTQKQRERSAESSFGAPDISELQTLDETDAMWNTLSPEQQGELLKIEADRPLERIAHLGRELLKQDHQLGAIALAVSERTTSDDLKKIAELAQDNPDGGWREILLSLQTLYNSGGTIKLPGSDFLGQSVMVGIKPGLSVDSLQTRDSSGKKFPPVDAKDEKTEVENMLRG